MTRSKKPKKLVKIMEETLDEISPIRFPVKRKIQAAIFLLLIAAFGFIIFNNKNILFKADTNGPAISILEPSNNSQIINVPTMIRATAKDNSGINEMTLYIDNTKVANTKSNTINYSWYFTSDGITSGTHKITVEALGKDGHYNTKTIFLNK